MKYCIEDPLTAVKDPNCSSLLKNMKALLKSLKEYLQLMDCINLMCKMLDDFTYKLNSPNQHSYTNSLALIFFPAEKRYLV